MWTREWSEEHIREAIQRGPHKSATEHVEFLRTEFVDMIQKGHWTLLPASLVEKLLGLRLSPLGVVPQRERRPRTICDYTYFGVNDETIAGAPVEAMQFGRALQRILHQIHNANPAHGPIYLSKIDIADGFYRVWLNTEDIPKLAVLFPTAKGEEPLIGFPLVLPMGWKESTPSFCTTTETIVDLANEKLRDPSHQPAPHRLDLVSETPAPEASSKAPQVSNPSRSYQHGLAKQRSITGMCLWTTRLAVHRAANGSDDAPNGYCCMLWTLCSADCIRRTTAIDKSQLQSRK